MSARAWERRRINKRYRMFLKRMRGVFGVPKLDLGQGSYQLHREQMQTYMQALQREVTLVIEPRLNSLWEGQRATRSWQDEAAEYSLDEPS